jgi:hypothetical protein
MCSAATPALSVSTSFCRNDVARADINDESLERINDELGSD